MNTHDKKINNLFIYWLSASLILVFFIIIVGGLTRLTNSGLSITEWGFDVSKLESGIYFAYLEAKGANSNNKSDYSQLIKIAVIK